MLLMQKSGRTNVVKTFLAFVTRSEVGLMRQATLRLGAESTLIDRADGADEFGKIFAVAGGVIERIEPRIAESFGQRNAARERAVGENELVPLNRRDLVVETRDRTAAKKCAGCFGWRKDRGLDLFFFDKA